MELLIRSTANEPKGPWKLEAEGGAAGSKIYTKAETYLHIGIFNQWRGYQLRLTPEEVKELEIDCREFLDQLREQGWDL